MYPLIRSCLRLVLASLLAVPALAQTTPEIPTVSSGSTYVFTRPVLVSRCNLALGLDSPPITYLIPAGYRFTVVKVIALNVVIKFVRFTTPDTSVVTRVVKRGEGKKRPFRKSPAEPDKGQILNNLLVAKPLEKSLLPTTQLPLDPLSPTAETLFFAVSTDELLRNAALWQPTWGRPHVAAGTVILPVKMRFAPFDFSRDFALGLTVGPRWHISHYQPHYLNLLVAFNANIVGLDSLSTGGHTRRTADLGALGMALGLVLDFNGPQVGIFSGLDWLSRRDQVANHWQYQGQPWLSVGVGFTVFTRNGATPTASATDTQPPAPK